MVQAAVGTQLVKAESTTSIIELLPAEAVACQPMVMEDQGFWRIGHSEAMTEPTFAEFPVLSCGKRKKQIETPDSLKSL